MAKKQLSSPTTNRWKPSCRSPCHRLQSVILELQRYRYDICIVHKPGKDIPVTDCLSRNLIGDAKPMKDVLSDKLDIVGHHMITSDPKPAEIRSNKSGDQSMQVLQDVILTGWPDQRKACLKMIRDHWNYRDELVFADGLIFKADRIVIPKVMRHKMLNPIHEGHFGIEKFRSRARMALFWPLQI